MRFIATSSALRGLVGAFALGLLASACATSGPTNEQTWVIDPNAGSTANIGSLTAAIQRDPQNSVNYNVRGSAYGQAGQFQAALADFTTAIQLNPGFYQAYNNRALLYREQLNQPQAALADYNQAITLNPTYQPAYLGRGILYRQNGQLDLAMADFDQAVTLNTSDAKGYYNRALIYQTRGNHVRAIADLDAAIALDANASEPYNARGLSRLQIGKNKDALQDFAAAVNRNKQSAEFWTNLGIAQIRTGDVQRGRDSINRAMVLKPGYGPAREALQSAEAQG
ncbi:MAG: lipoprotein NlpI [Proteobacteria bacterium]|nr:lipoprotein NlpI [Pseudomonadota bacterium]